MCRLLPVPRKQYVWEIYFFPRNVNDGGRFLRDRDANL